MLIEIPGSPVPKLRARITKRGGYDPQKAIKNLYRSIILTQYNRLKSKNAQRSPVSAYHVSMYFYFPVPVSWSQKRKKQALEGKLKHTTKPDCDNLEKFVADCATGILYEDDRMIVSQCACKAYAENPRTVIEIEEI